MAGKDQSGMGRGLASGLELAVGVGLGVLVGTGIDHRYKSGPWGVLIGAGIGFAAGMYLLFKEALRSDKK